MGIEIRAYEAADAPAATRVFNEVIEAGNAFPQEFPFEEAQAHEFFLAQSFTGVACDVESGEVLGLYILHPNNIERCGHIANASYAVAAAARGRGVGEMLVRHCLDEAPRHGFRILQFNAVVATNTAARRLYAKLGFTELGVIRGGFRMSYGTYEDIVPAWIALDSKQ